MVAQLPGSDKAPTSPPYQPIVLPEGEDHAHFCCDATVTHLELALDELEELNKERNRLLAENGALTEEVEHLRHLVRERTRANDLLGARLDRAEVMR